MSEFKNFSNGDSNFKVLHLNINSILGNLYEVDEILNTCHFDIACFSETKLDDSIPNSFLINNFYTRIRLDRNRHGGGLIIFIKNGIKIKRTFFHKEIELIYFQLEIKNQKFNFIYCYRSPCLKETQYLDKLEDFLQTLNLNESLFVIGDLNMDCKNKQNSKIEIFLANNDLINFITKPTRVCTKFSKKNNNIKSTNTIIDLILHNGDLIDETDTIECPFSDHNFILAKLTIKKQTAIRKNILCRNLSQDNLIKISSLVDCIDLRELKNYETIEDKWIFVRDKFVSIVDEVAPLREICVNLSNQFPWYDQDLISAKHSKDASYKKYKRSLLSADKDVFEFYKRQFKKLNDEKLIEFFKDKTVNDFKNAKKFWKFYSPLIKIKSNEKSAEPTINIKFSNKTIDDKKEVCNIFNKFFTTISTSSSSTIDKSSAFINENFSDAENLNDFKFSFTSGKEINDLILDLDSSSSGGVCGIPTKCLKNCSDKFKSIIAYLFNFSILTCKIPEDWKTAVVTPLFKNKGLTDDMNNYRGISVLPPFAKLFEKLLHKQISNYLNVNKILSNDQHGFRSNHGCESALHEIISQMNSIKSKRLIGLFLFIDFKKAFDTVDQKLLLLKLRKYGFSDMALRLMENYFIDRKQFVKIDNEKSDFMSCDLGVPQGSVLGPLLFLVYINDIVKFLSDFTVKLFADDTTLIQVGNDINELIEAFNNSIKKLLVWCHYNRIDINWSKTKIMFVSNKKKTCFPTTISIDKNDIEVVDNFKLLGVIIDNRLNFLKNVYALRNSLNKRIHAIKRLFFLSYKVKLQFFKSFILPYFDYCMSLAIYFPKKTIQKLANSYNFCLYKLLNIRFKVVESNDFNHLNNLLNQYNIDCFQHRVITRLSRFVYKIINYNTAPLGLKSTLIRNLTVKENYNLRNKNEYLVPFKGKFNDYNQKTFDYFYSKFINKFLIHDLNLEFGLFVQRIKNNINIIFLKFCELFKNFDLVYNNFFLY